MEKERAQSGSVVSVRGKGSMAPLAPIVLLPLPSSRKRPSVWSEEPSSASSTPGEFTSQEPPVKHACTSASTPTEYKNNSFNDQSVVIERKDECSQVIFCPKNVSNTRNLGTNLENNTVINGYRIIGTGKDAAALHLASGEVYSARLITERDFNTTLQVANRLEKAHELCAEFEWDIDELRLKWLSRTWERAGEDSFSSFEYSNLHVMVSTASSTSNSGLSEEKVAGYFKQIPLIMAFCHQLGIVLRDLKPRKLVFTNESQTKIRLSDVFDVVVCDSASDDVLTEMFGSPAYIPPEVFSARHDGFAGRPADVWGLGVLTFLLLTGKYPFYDANPHGVFTKIRRAHVCFPSGLSISRSGRDMVQCMLRKRPEDRPTAALLAQIPWLSVKNSSRTIRVNHMISPLSNPLRRQQSIVSSDVLADHEVPETHSTQ